MGRHVRAPKATGDFDVSRMSSGDVFSDLPEEDRAKLRELKGWLHDKEGSLVDQIRKMPSGEVVVLNSGQHYYVSDSAEPVLLGPEKKLPHAPNRAFPQSAKAVLSWWMEETKLAARGDPARLLRLVQALSDCETSKDPWLWPLSAAMFTFGDTEKKEIHAGKPDLLRWLSRHFVHLQLSKNKDGGRSKLHKALRRYGIICRAR